MATSDLERRVANLESQLGELREEIHADRQRKSKDWRRTIGAFTDDEGMRQILKDAMSLREADRKRARAKTTTKRKTRR